MRQVRNPWHLRALIAACEKVGVRLHSNAGADGWEFDGDRVTGARLSNGERVTAGRFLLAAGAWSEGLLRRSATPRTSTRFAGRSRPSGVPGRHGC